MNKHEIVSLNLIDLDVSELERRVELAAAAVAPSGGGPWLCGVYDNSCSPILKTGA